MGSLAAIKAATPQVRRTALASVTPRSARALSLARMQVKATTPPQQHTAIYRSPADSGTVGGRNAPAALPVAVTRRGFGLEPFGQGSGFGL